MGSFRKVLGISSLRTILLSICNFIIVILTMIIMTLAKHICYAKFVKFGITLALYRCNMIELVWHPYLVWQAD